MTSLESGRRSGTDRPASPIGPPFATLCYQSRASRRTRADDLAQLVVAARDRNRRFGVTGMLVHEGDRFFQWLEGPRTALDGLWSAIRRDERHEAIEVLGEGVTPIRLFSQFNLKFLHRGEGEVADPDGARPPPIAGAPPDAEATRVAELALAGDDEGLDAWVHDQLAAGLDARAICRRLLEPAAQRLGDWWCEDRCDSFGVTLGLSRLQNLARSLEGGQASRRVVITGQRVLISPPPKETHLLGATLLGGFFRQAGWSVQAEFPKTDAELTGLVNAEWFDAIGLTLSDVFTRRERLGALVKTISDVRAASRNPAMAVIVGGRAFRPEAAREADRVGADVHYASAADAVNDLNYWLFAQRFVAEASRRAAAREASGLKPLDVVRMITPGLVRRVARRTRASG